MDPQERFPTHLVGRATVALDRQNANRLLDEMEVIPKDNVQELIGSTMSSTMQDKYIYRLVLDFDCTPKDSLTMDNVVARVGKFAQHLICCYKPYILHNIGKKVFNVNAILTSRMKYFENENVTVERWHVHYLNVVFVDDKACNGANILTPVRKLGLLAMKVDWPDLDVTAGSSQWLVYNSRKFDSTSAYKYVTSLKFEIDTDTEDFRLDFYGPQNISSKSLRHILSLHKDVDDMDIVIDWTRIPSNNLESILVARPSTSVQQDLDHVSSEDEGLDGNGDIDNLGRCNEGFQLLSSSAEWGDIFANEQEQRINISFPDGRPTFQGRRLNNARPNSPEICIKLAKAYKGISYCGIGEPKTTAIAREYVFKWALLKLVYFANYASTYDKWYRLLLIVASNMNYNVGRRIFRVLSKTVQKNMKDDPGFHYDRAVAWLWRYTPVESLTTEEEDDENEEDADFETTRSDRLIPTMQRAKTQRGRKRKNMCGEELNAVKPLNLPRRLVRLQYEPLFQMTNEDKETSEWLLSELIKGMGVVNMVYNEYIKRLLSISNVCMLVHNKASDSYDLFKYNAATGTMVLDDLSKLILDLELVAIKTCFEYESAGDNITPFDLCYNFLRMSTKKLEHKVDFSNLNTYLQSGANNSNVNLTTNRHLVLPDNVTYDLYDAKYIPWDASQLCTVRSDCKLDLGKDELVEHVYTEIHPMRGGIQYRCKVICNWMDSAWKAFEQRNFGKEMLTILRSVTMKVSDKMLENRDPDKFMEDFLDELYSDPSTRFQEYFENIEYDDEIITSTNDNCLPSKSEIHKLNDETSERIKRFTECDQSKSKFGLYIATASSLLAMRIMLQRHPDMYAPVMDKATICTSENDDGGPVVFVKNEITWDQLVWTMLIEIFGSSEQARLVLEFLALGLYTDSNGRLVMFMHGEAVNGKSMFIGILNYIFGKKSNLVRTLPANFFTSKSDNRMDATFRSNAEEIRFAIENEIPILDMDEGGRRKFKQFTGGDRVSSRQPYDRCNNDFRISAKFVTSSNDMPYISSTMLAEQSRLMIIPTVSTFIAGKVMLRKQLLQHLAADRYCRRLYGTAYPSFKGLYTIEMNKYANVMTKQTLTNLNARNTLFPMHYNNILNQGFPCDIIEVPKGIPTQRWLLGNPLLMHEEVQEKMGAALCRILLDHIVPSMGGLKNTAVTVQKMENYVRENVNLFGSYKDVMLILLKRLIVYRKGECIDVDSLRAIVVQEMSVMKSNIRSLMFGKYKGAGSEAFSKVDNACKTINGFCNMLVKCNFNLTKRDHCITLNDFQLVHLFINERNKIEISPIEGMLNIDDLKTYLTPENIFTGPDESDTVDARKTCLKPPIVMSDFVYGSFGDDEDAHTGNETELDVGGPRVEGTNYFSTLSKNSMWGIIDARHADF
ncbi:uncharacterized protein LOC121835536 [Ixodes scapularis]|uniref:uncharacterized protein LOC121835536 n=1 Tax=Ixodes scapularis TaxID=6945 RepID=UPI001A9CC229|nr:uncharacterized protein LOC121835536 [Ixodes scapularis]